MSCRGLGGAHCRVPVVRASNALPDCWIAAAGGQAENGPATDGRALRSGRSWSPGMTSYNPKPTARNRRLYLARMQAYQTEAQVAALPNVRDSALRAAVAWREMQDRMSKRMTYRP